MKKDKKNAKPAPDTCELVTVAAPGEVVSGMVAQINQDIIGAEIGMFRTLRAGVGLLTIKGMVEYGNWELRMIELFPGRSARTLYRYMKQVEPLLAQHQVSAEQAWADVSQIDATQVCGLLAAGDQPMKIAETARGQAKGKAAKTVEPADEAPQSFAQMLLDFMQQRKAAQKPAEPAKPITKREKIEAAIAKANSVVNASADFITDGLWAFLPDDELESTMAGLRAAADKLRQELKVRESNAKR